LLLRFYFRLLKGQYLHVCRSAPSLISKFPNFTLFSIQVGYGISPGRLYSAVATILDDMGGQMLGHRSLLGVVSLWVAASCLLFGQDQDAKPVPRNPVLLDVLARVINAAGGTQALAAVHDLTESGEITFHWGDGVDGPVTIQTLGGNHFRMEAELPKGKRTWVVSDGNGTRKEGDRKVVPLSGDSAINLGNLTFPVAQVAAALADPKTDISLVGIETRDGRSIYRVRVKGQLGLSSTPIPILPVVKDLLIDALNFSILSIEDRPFRTYQAKRKLSGKAAEADEKLSDKPPREIQFEDFRTVNGVLVPFSVSTKLMGQETMSIHLTKVAFNSNLSPDDFKN
jgi:hypothetical protein